jgi:GTP pyrophosphokinase
MIRLNDITSQILSYHPNANIDLVEKAYVYSAKAHQGQIRLSGEPYLSHPLENLIYPIPLRSPTFSPK